MPIKENIDVGEGGERERRLEARGTEGREIEEKRMTDIIKMVKKGRMRTQARRKKGDKKNG